MNNAVTAVEGKAPQQTAVKNPEGTNNAVTAVEGKAPPNRPRSKTQKTRTTR
jgi:hypothetical protein